MLAKLFLEDLGATLVSGPESDYGYDFIVAFPNGAGGMNFSGVEVKGVDHPVDSYPLDTKWYQRMARSNIPSLLLVVDAKQNRIYHAWPAEVASGTKAGRMVRVPIAPIDDSAKEELRNRLAGATEQTELLAQRS
ncbi:MAG: DUF4365 domain-containing protein [Bryobacteraceae bacterium]